MLIKTIISYDISIYHLKFENSIYLYMLFIIVNIDTTPAVILFLFTQLLLFKYSDVILTETDNT